MKKLVSLILTVTVMVLSVIPAVSATESDLSKEYFEDGSYLTIATYSQDDIHTESGLSFIAKLISAIKQLISRFFDKFSDNAETVAKSKRLCYYDKNGMLLWSFTLNAEFTYNRSSAECKAVSVSSEIYDGDWKKLYSACSKSGASAYGEIEMQQYKLGVPLKNYKKSVTLTCDKNGNVA